MLDGTLLERVDHLIAGEMASAGDFPRFFKIRHNEIAAPGGLGTLH